MQTTFHKGVHSVFFARGDGKLAVQLANRIHITSVNESLTHVKNLMNPSQKALQFFLSCK